MSEGRAAKIGTIGWIDLTVPEAQQMRDFYSAVVGWEAEEVDMGEYADFTMKSPDGAGRAGVCHSRGGNDGIPQAWMIYINVDDLDQSLEACRARGGEVLGEIRSMGAAGRYAFIRDPGGAACALFEPPE